MSNKIHEIKILPEYYCLVSNGIKKFEVRLNDRNYKVGDILYLEEFSKKGYTGNKIIKKIKYILDDINYCKEGYIIIGF